MKILHFICLLCFLSCSSAQTQDTYVINLDGEKKSRFVFSDMFKSVNTIILETNENCLIGVISKLQYFNGSLYADVRKFEPANGDFMLFRIDPDNGKIQAKYFPVLLNKNWNELFSTGHRPFLHFLNKYPLYTQLFMDNIMLMDGNSKPKSYITLQSKNMTTVRDIEKLKTNDAIERYKNYKSLENTSKIYDIDNYIERGNLIYFEYHQSKEKHSVIYNTKTRETQIANVIHNNMLYRNSDTHQYFYFFDQRGVYDIPFPTGMDNLSEYLKENKFVADLDKIDQLKSLTEESNPVIFYYEFKDN